MSRRPADWPDELLPTTLGERTIRGWKSPAHVLALQEQCLRLVRDDDYNRLVVEMPVRHGKSTYCSHVFLAWYMLTHPDRQVMLAGYGKEFAAEWTTKVRNLIRDYGDRITGVRIGAVDQQVKFTLAAPHSGVLRAVSPGSGVAGKGAHLIVCDDLVKDMKEVANPARRNTLTTWVNAELLSRLEPGGKVLAVMSRRHPDDQSGRWLAQNPELDPADRWRRFTLPAIDAGGNALWPQRYSLKRLEAIKRRYEIDGQSYLWSCLYQQDPRGDSALIEWPDRYFEGIECDGVPPGLPVRFRLLSLDPSKGANSKTGDYSAWCDVAVEKPPGGRLWVRPHLLVLPTEAVEDYTVGLLQREDYHGLVVECNGFQEVVADNIARKCAARGVRCPLWKRYSTENKEVRVRLALGPLLEQKKIRIDSTCPSARLALNQLREFPTAAHDDFPDSLTLCWDLIGHLIGGHSERSEGWAVAAAR